MLSIGWSTKLFSRRNPWYDEGWKTIQWVCRWSIWIIERSRTLVIYNIYINEIYLHDNQTILVLITTYHILNNTIPIFLYVYSIMLHNLLIIISISNFSLTSLLFINIHVIIFLYVLLILHYQIHIILLFLMHSLQFHYFYLYIYIFPITYYHPIQYDMLI